MFETIFIQAIGFVGVACFIISYQIKSNKALFAMQVTGTCLFCLQFLLLEAYTGCFNLMLVILRNLMLLFAEGRPWILWKGWPVIFSAASAVIIGVTWQGPLSLLVFAAMVASMFGYWTRNAQKIRLCNLAVSSPAWLIYDLFVGSIGGVISESITLISIIVSIFRYGWKNLGDPEFGKKSI